jgi:hypothetical protein
MIGWESNNITIGPIAAAAKQSLLRLIPYIMPIDSDQAFLYRLVLEYGDFGIHNISIIIDANGQPLITSLYDWETGYIIPAILSDPLVSVEVDLVIDENATPLFIRVPDDATPDDHVQYVIWARQYFMVYPSFKYLLSQYISREVTAFLCTGSLQSSARLRTCNPGRERRTPPLVCAARVAR